MNDDSNIISIRQLIHKHLPNAKITLFGSRALGSNVATSDYDILIISPTYLSVSEIKNIKSILRKELALLFIPIDIVLVNKNEIQEKAKLTNHIVNEALLHGIEL